MLLKTRDTEKIIIDKENKDINIKKMYNELNSEYREIKKNIYDDLLNSNQSKIKEEEDLNPSDKHDDNYLENTT